MSDSDNPNSSPSIDLPADLLIPSPEDEAIYLRAAVEVAKRKARAGDPFPFIELQWPWLSLVNDLGEVSEDRKYFETDLRLDVAQVDILRHVFHPSHTECFIKGCTKYGKGFVTALAVNIWFDIYDGAKVILTGPDHAHVKGNLFAEVSYLRKRMLYPSDSEVQTEQIIDRGNEKHFVKIANPKSGEGFSGQHGEHTLFVFDEASACANFYYDNAKKQARFIIALSNPRTLGGWFREGFGKFEPDVNKSLQTSFGMRRLVTADGGETVNVKNKRIEKPFAPPDGIEVVKEKNGKIDTVSYGPGEPISAEDYEYVKPLIPAQVDYARYYDIMSDPDENQRLVFGRGHFPKEDADLQVILQSWVARAIAAWHSEIEVQSFGLDVAISAAGDSTILAAGGEGGCLELVDRPGADTPVTCAWVLATVLSRYGIDLKAGVNPVAVDYGGGYGSGVGDRLAELGVRVIKVVPNKRSSKPNKYKNVRAEVWGELGRRLNVAGDYADQPAWALPDDPVMCEDILAQEKVMNADGISYFLIPKDKPYPGYTGRTVKDKLQGRSPDRGDAVSLLWRAVHADEAVDDYAGGSLVSVVGGSVKGDKRDKDNRVIDIGGVVGNGSNSGSGVSADSSLVTNGSDEWDATIRAVCERMDSAGDGGLLG